MIYFLTILEDQNSEMRLTGLTQGMERSFDEDAERNTKSKREREACHMEPDSPRKFVCVCVFF